MPRDVRFIPPTDYCYYCIVLPNTDALGAEVVADATNCISGRVPLSPLIFRLLDEPADKYVPQFLTPTKVYSRMVIFCKYYLYFEFLCDAGYRVFRI